MSYGKSIRLFLIEGDPNGRWVCELSNWIGKAYKIPRTLVKSSSDRQELLGTGIYFLFGKSDEDATEQVYIGEAENVLDRLIQHLTSKDFWSECVVFITSDNHINKAHIKYLENRMNSIAKEANRYEIMNKNTPPLSSLSEADKAEMEEFISNSKLLLSALGHKVLEPVITEQDQTNRSNLYYIDAVHDAKAKGQLVTDGFVVFKGSAISTTTADSAPSSLLTWRKKLITSGVIDDHFVFTEDKIFSSPSLAASIVLGRSANGRTEWKNDKGKNLKSSETI